MLNQKAAIPAPVEQRVMTHFYSWRNNEKRLTLYNRPCRVIGRFKKMNSCLLEFENGQQEVVSRNAIRRLKCEKCGDIGATRNRQMTAYNDDTMNFANLCPECQEECNKYWKERWSDYYAGCL
jgi:hypothetical protein